MKTRWVVAEPEEVVAYVAFDPSAVHHRLPRRLRFITLEELGAGGVHWAAEFLSQHPAKRGWGVSFIEIVRMDTFSVDGRSPKWPQHGAAALWFARVAPSDPRDDLGPGQPFLALEFWISDRDFATYMRTKGYPATYGKATLHKDPKGIWLGSVLVDGLQVTTACRPTGPVSGGIGSAGMQAFFPPASSRLTDVIRVAFAGHREQSCTADSTWKFLGSHPLVSGIVLGASSFQFGYHLFGGTYAP